jgi:hypothetical protein
MKSQNKLVFQCWVETQGFVHASPTIELQLQVSLIHLHRKVNKLISVQFTADIQLLLRFLA